MYLAAKGSIKMLLGSVRSFRGEESGPRGRTGDGRRCPGRGGRETPASVAGMQGVAEIDRGERREDVGLQTGDEELEGCDGDAERQRQRGDRPPGAGGQRAGTKPAKILRAMWPASTLAKRRTARLMGREMNDTISMATIIGISQPGTPEGTNTFRNFVPWAMKPYTITVPITRSARAKVTMIVDGHREGVGDHAEHVQHEHEHESEKMSGMKRSEPWPADWRRVEPMNS